MRSRFSKGPSPEAPNRRGASAAHLWLASALALGIAAWLHAAPARAQDVDAGPYVPTPQYIVDRMLQMAAVSGKDYVIDLGSGDGRIVITAAKRFGARGMGVDISEKLVDLATTNSYKEQVAGRVRFVRQDAFKTDIGAASVLTLYLLPRFVLDLRPKMLVELKPGSRIVSHDYSLGDWDADNAITFDSPEKEVVNGASQTSLFYYVVPARVAGTWRFSLPEGMPQRSAEIQLQQSYQKITGTISGAKARPLAHAALRGERIELALPLGGRNYVASGQVSGERIEGTIEVAGRGKLPFSATRTAPGKAVGWP
ncbi:MAG: class I SAM-dependent methyltransferase [Burkholderiales bacterium]|nr:class I SAM-dependent methyltransferase [Burkholderiales bacterium]